MKNAVIYARYSSDKQNEQSIEGQLRVCEEFAKRNEIKIIKNFIDRAQSGTNDNRAQFQKMLKESAKGLWEYVIVYKLDRFSRNKYEMAIHRKFLRDHGIKILSAMENIPDTPEGIILESLLEGMAEYYSAELSQKVKRGNRENRLKGLYTGGAIPLGFKVKNKKVYVDEYAKPFVIQVFEDYLAGKGLDSIKDNLNAAGFAKGRRSPFTNSTIYNMLHNEKYIGITKYNGEIFNNIYPQLIPNSLYNAVQERAELFKYGRNPNRLDDSYLLRNKVFCGLCGHPFISESGGGRDKIIRKYYKCAYRKSKKLCTNIILKKEILEQFVMDITCKIFESTENFSEIVNKIYDLHQQRVTSNGMLNVLLGQKNLISSSITNLIKYAETGIATDETNARIIELKAQLLDVNKQIESIRAKTTSEITKEDIAKYLRTVLKTESNVLVNLLINKIVIYPKKIDITYNFVDKELRENKPLTPIVILSEKKEFEKGNTKIGVEPEIVKLDINGCI